MSQLTVSGNEITPATRAQALQWGTAQQGGSTDGLTAGFGVWEAGTNLHPHGQCDVFNGANFIGTQAGSVLSIDTATAAPFSPQSLRAVCDGGTASQGARMSSNTGLAAAAGVIGVASVYFKGVAGQSYTPYSRWNNTDATSNLFFGSNFTATGDWQLIVAPAATVAVGKTGDTLSIAVQINGTRAETIWYAHPMLQSGVNVVSPYVATSSGATAARAGAAITAPSSLVGLTSGWFAARIQVGFSWTNSGLGGVPASLVTLSQDSSNFFEFFYRLGDGSWRMRAEVAGASTGDAVIITPQTMGDHITVVGYYTATQVAVSVNGSAFTVTTPSSMPVLTTPNFTIGSQFSGGQLDGNILWFACGTGALTNTDAAVINGWGNAAPILEMFPAAAKATAVMPFATADYIDYPLIPILGGRS